jgi:large subunit ribosomal protein L25
MAKILDLSAQPRSASGSVAVRRLRKTGRIPAVVYGKKHENKNLELDGKTFVKLLQASSSDNILVNLKIEGETAESLALVQDVQHDYLRGGILHVDFHAVSADEEIHAGVPVILQGVEAAEKKGGMLEHILHTLEVRCLPKDLPERLTLDVSVLELNQSKHVSDLTLPEGVKTKIDAQPLCPPPVRQPLPPVPPRPLPVPRPPHLPPAPKPPRPRRKNNLPAGKL